MGNYLDVHVCTPLPLIRVSSLAFPKQAVQAAQAAVQRRNARQQKKMQARQKLARERAQKLSIKNGKTAREEAARKAQVRARVGGDVHPVGTRVEQNIT